MAKFTAGPWKHVAIRGGWDGVTDSTGRGALICCLEFNNSANARLIAAAPEMYEVIKEFMSYGNIFRAKMGEEPPYLKAQKLIKEIDGDDNGR